MDYKKLQYNSLSPIPSLENFCLFHSDGYLYLPDVDSDSALALIDFLGSGTSRDAIRRQLTHHGPLGGMTVDNDFPSVQLHSETSFSPSQPSLVSFYCAANTLDHGQTIICDGRKLWSLLPHRIRQFFLETPISYKLQINLGLKRRKSGYKEWYIDKPGSISPVVDFSTSTLRQTYNASAVHLDPFSSKLAFANHLLIELYTEPQIVERSVGSLSCPELNHLRNSIITAAHSLSQAVHWRSSDLLLLSNKIFMHGRLFCPDQQGRQISVFQRNVFKLPCTFAQ